MKLHCLAGKAVALLLSLFTWRCPSGRRNPTGRKPSPSRPARRVVPTTPTGPNSPACSAAASVWGRRTTDRGAEPEHPAHRIRRRPDRLRHHGRSPWPAGTAPARGQGRQFRSMRAIFPMYDTPFAFAVLNRSPSKASPNWRASASASGPQGGTAGTYIPKFLAALNLQATLVERLLHAELAAQLQAGKIDVLAAAAGRPFRR